MINDSKSKVAPGSDVMFDRMAAWRGSLDQLGKSISDKRVPLPEAAPSEAAADNIEPQPDDVPPSPVETPTLAPVEATAPDHVLPANVPARAIETPLLTMTDPPVHAPDPAPPPAPHVSMEQPTLEEAGRLLQQISRLEHEAHVLRLILGERNLSANEHRILADVDAEITALRQNWRSDNPLHS